MLKQSSATRRISVDKFRQKRSDKKRKTIERIYGKNFSVKGSVKLCTFLKKNNYSSLLKLLKE